MAAALRRLSSTLSDMLQCKNIDSVNWGLLSSFGILAVVLLYLGITPFHCEIYTCKHGFTLIGRRRGLFWYSNESRGDHWSSSKNCQYPEHQLARCTLERPADTTVFINCSTAQTCDKTNARRLRTTHSHFKTRSGFFLCSLLSGPFRWADLADCLEHTHCFNGYCRLPACSSLYHKRVLVLLQSSRVIR